MKIFLASSGELISERDQIEILISRKSNAIKELGINLTIETVRWENLPQNFAKERKQKVFNKAISECEVLIVLFFKKVGKFTKEELNTAYDNFKSEQNPKYIYVFFFEPPTDLGELNEEYISIIEMKKFITKEEQMFISVTSKSELLLRITYELDFIISQKSILTKEPALLIETEKLRKEIELIKSDLSGKKDKESTMVKSQKEEFTVTIKEEKRKEEILTFKLLLEQLHAQNQLIIKKIEKDEIVFGQPNPSDIAEKARLEYQINNLNKEIEKLKK